MARSVTGNYEEIQHQCQLHTSHWKSVWHGPKCSPVQWQHRRMVHNYSRSSTSVSTLTLFNIFLERIMCEALDDHELQGSVSIGGRLITNFRFADDRLDRTTTRYKMEIGPDKTKVMTNNPNGFQREIKIKGQMLEEVENFKHLGALISNEGSKPEILSRIAQTTAALSRLKIIWRDKKISLAYKVKLMRTLILSTFLYACESWTLTAEIEKRIQTLETRCSRRLLNISYKGHVTNEEVRNRIQNTIGSPNYCKETETQMVWPHLKILWHGEDNSVRDSERSKKEKKTEEEMGR